MAKLYPPNIEGTLPAFCGSALTVPFSMNRAVSTAEVRGFAIKIKRVNDNSLIYTGRTDNFDTNFKFEAYFIVSESLFNVGEFYKVQIAYIENTRQAKLENETIGYYSTVGIIKYTTKPKVFIEGMSNIYINTHNYQYTGIYSQTDADGKFLDTTEKMYSSEFRLLDANNNLVKTSGEIIHDTSKDTERYQSVEEFFISSDLELDISYYLTYTVTTVNGLVVTSPRYRIMQRRMIPMSLQVDFSADLDYENGRIAISLISEKFQIASGSFLISRASSKDNYVWEEFKYFHLQSEQPDKRQFYDYTVEQGVTYKYSLQQYNSNGIYSNRQISNEVYVDFEDLFLYDGKRQLRVRYNPKVTNLKNDVIESKTDTIGSQYPFILRNGKVKYKEFSISGLISYKMDEVETFCKLSEIGIDTTKYAREDLMPEKAANQKKITTNLEDYNIAAERFFKLEVLEWLTNGEPKIFRSPTEGNYIVRLMNASMAPNDTLGRMLHTFTCTAYEIADFTYSNLSFYGFIKLKENQKTVMRWISKDLRTLSQLNLKAEIYNTLPEETKNNYTLKKDSGLYELNDGVDWIKLNSYPAYHIEFAEMMPGARIAIKFNANDLDYSIITIGATGYYLVDLNTPVYGIYISASDSRNMSYQGLLHYGYKTLASDIFDNIVNLKNGDVPCRQFIGSSIIGHTYGYNLLPRLSDVRTAVLTYYYARFIKRELCPIYVKREIVGDNPDFSKLTPWDDNFEQEEGEDILDENEKPISRIFKFYRDGDRKQPVSVSSLIKNEPWNIYEIRFCREDYRYGNINSSQYIPGEEYYVDREQDQFKPSTGYYFDVSNQSLIDSTIHNERYFFGEIDDLFYHININGNDMSLEETEHYEFDNTFNLKNITFGNGIICEIGYQTQTTIYSFEYSNSKVVGLKNNYELALNKYLNERMNGSSDVEFVYTSYNSFITALQEVIDEYNEENGTK